MKSGSPKRRNLLPDRTFVKYKISISRIDAIETISRSWVKIADTGNEQDNGPKYGYAEQPSNQFSETTILTQEIREENLDIKTIIKAINGI